MQQLGRNQGGYRGETIDIESVLRAVSEAAERHGWCRELFLDSPSAKLLGLQRTSEKPSRRLYISTGIHGDEPAGPLAVRQLVQEDRWPAGVVVWLCPCLNPAGFQRNQRENASGIDLNRQYLHLEAEEVRAHVAWLGRQPRFDVTLGLHEDWEARGFYLYELNPDNQRSLGETIIRRVAAVCPIDPSPVIDNREAHHGIIRPNLDPRSRPEWPEAFYLMMHKTRLSYTLEAPSNFPLPVRVATLVTGVRAVLEALGPSTHAPEPRRE
jgi:protein MpaA